MNIELKDVGITTKADADEIFKRLVSSVLDGDVNPLKVEAFFVIIEHAIKSARERIAENSFRELNLIGKQGDVVGCVHFTLQERKTLQYSESKIYQEKEKELEAIKELIKTATNTGQEIALTDSGEVIEPVSVKITTSIIRKLK